MRLFPAGCFDPHLITSARVRWSGSPASSSTNSASLSPAWFFSLITVYTSGDPHLDPLARRFEVVDRATVYLSAVARAKLSGAQAGKVIRRAELVLSLGSWAVVIGFGNLAGSGQQPARPSYTPKTYAYQVLARYPHDRKAFTQGLTYHGGYLYESTGLEGQSSLRKVDLTSGKVLKKVDVDGKYFAEGLTVFRGKIYQLTWLSAVGFIYDIDTLDKTGEFHYEGEGWGLTSDSNSLIMSDGSNRLKFLDPKDFKVQRSIDVFYQGRPLNQLNELEYINGEIYSNVWHRDLIARIDPATGRLLGIIDLTGLGAGLGLGSEDTLNGIAYLPKSASLLVTGKRWPLLFRLKIQAAGE